MRRLLPLLLVTLSLLPGADQSMTLQGASIAGFRLDEAAAKAAEERVAAAPDDAQLRATLLGYYMTRGRTAVAARRAHVLWFIRHLPHERFSANPECGIFADFDPQGYAEGERAWTEALAAKPQEPQVRIGLANFIRFQDRPRAIALVREGLATMPDHPLLEEALVSHLRLSDLPADRQETFDLQRKLLDRAPAGERSHRLGAAAEAAVRAEQWDQACAWAREWIRLTSEVTTWDTGNAIHNGHQVLGLAALARQDEPQALAELAAAATSHGSPQLNSFGPDFRLATALLERGYRAEVAAYLRQVATFWKKPAVAGWISSLEQGKTPELKR